MFIASNCQVAKQSLSSGVVANKVTGITTTAVQHGLPCFHRLRWLGDNKLKHIQTFY